MIHFMLLSDFAIPMKGQLDDVDSDVLGRLVLSVCVSVSLAVCHGHVSSNNLGHWMSLIHVRLTSSTPQKSTTI